MWLHLLLGWYFVVVFRTSFTHIFDSHRYHSYEKTSHLKEPVPYNLTVYKGWKNVILSHSFSQFVLTHPVALKLREWTKDMEIPDEGFFSTLARITKITRNRETGNFSVVQNHVNELHLKKGLCPRCAMTFLPKFWRILYHLKL